MVLLPTVLTSNDQIPTSLPPGLVAVFVGGTSGIGEATLKLLAKRAIKPKIYIVGRSISSAERIIAECRILNPEGEYVFMKKDLDLMRNVVEVCDDIKVREKFIHLLVLSMGSPDLTKSLTTEGLHRFYALLFYARILFIQSLLPLLHAAPPNTLKRILSIAAGSYEGAIQINDLPALTLPLLQLRAHAASMMALAFQHLQRENKEVAFVIDHPGTVVTPLLDGYEGFLGFFLRTMIFLFGRWITLPIEESAERHVFLATSAAFAPGIGDAVGVPVVGGLEVHGGVDGEKGSGLYSVNWRCEGPGDKVVELLKGFEEDGTAEKVWGHYAGELERIQREA